MSSSPWEWLWNGDEDVATPFHAGAVSQRSHGVGAHLDTAPFWKGCGAAMSSSPWEWLWNGDEDVATPFHAGAVSQCSHGVVLHGKFLAGFGDRA
jgi:hypothetical protein